MLPVATEGQILLMYEEPPVSFMWKCLAYSVLLYIVGFVHFQECKVYLFIERYIVGSSSEDIMINAGISRICFMLAFLIICFIRLQIWHL